MSKIGRHVLEEQTKKIEEDSTIYGMSTKIYLGEYDFGYRKGTVIYDNMNKLLMVFGIEK